MPDAIPAQDGDLLTWSINFNTQLTAAPTSIGLVAGDATAYDALHDTYAAAYAAAIDPGTRTSVTIAAKDAARAALVTKARSLMNIAQAFPGTTNGERALFGMNIPDPLPSPIPVPSAKPVCSVEDILNLEHVIRVRDEATPTSNAKPAGTIGAEVWCKIGPTPPVSIADCFYVGLLTRFPYSVSHDPLNARKDAYYITRFINAVGETGPTSDVTAATIAA